MSDSSDNSLSDGDYYDVDISTYYNETEVFTDDELQDEEHVECNAIKSDIQDAYSTANEGESTEDLSNVMRKDDNDADLTTLKDDLLDFNNDGNTLSNRQLDLLAENTTSAYESGGMTDENTTMTYNSDGMTDENTTSAYDSGGMKEENTTSAYDRDGMKKENTTTTYDRDGMKKENTTTTYNSDGMTDENKLSTAKFDKKTKQKEETYTNMKFTRKTLNKLRRLLVDETHANDDHELYIGDLLNAIESELMTLPKEKKKVAKKPQVNIAIKPKKPIQKKLKVLSRYAIRSMGLKREHHLRNMKVLASSISEQFIELDDMIEYFRQVNAEFDAQFNQPNTPLGEPNLASKRMDDVFMKFKVRIPALQDCYKEIKHCLSLYVKSDKTLKDDLLKNINKYFVNSRVEEVLSVQYEEILEAFRKSNRLHYRF